MMYSIGVTTLAKDKWNKIQKKSIPAILNKLGLNKNFPRRVAFGPKELCGQSLLDMSVEQGVQKMMDFVNNVFARTSVGNMMLIELRHLQLESGSGFHLLEAPAMRIPFLTLCWTTAMQDFMAENQMKLEVTKAKVLPLCREGDRYLMDDFRALQNLDDADLYDINRVRIFLQVMTLSDNVDAAGLSITAEAFDASKLLDRVSPLKWPRQLKITTNKRICGRKLKRVPTLQKAGTYTTTWESGYDSQTKHGTHCVIPWKGL